MRTELFQRRMYKLACAGLCIALGSVLHAEEEDDNTRVDKVQETTLDVSKYPKPEEDVSGANLSALGTSTNTKGGVASTTNAVGVASGAPSVATVLSPTTGAPAVTRVSQEGSAGNRGGGNGDAATGTAGAGTTAAGTAAPAAVTLGGGPGGSSGGDRTKGFQGEGANRHGGPGKADTPLAKQVIGLTGVAVKLDNDSGNRPDLIIGWLDQKEGDDKGTVHTAPLYNLHETGGFDAMGKIKKSKLSKTASLAHGIGMAATKFKGEEASRLVLTFVETAEGGQNLVRYQLSKPVKPDGEADWGKPVATPVVLPKDVLGLNTVIGDLNANGKPELIVGWVEKKGTGIAAYYIIGTDLDAQGQVVGWSNPVPVEDVDGKMALGGVRGVALDLAQVTFNPLPELIFATLLTNGPALQLNCVVALNLDPRSGLPQGWQGYQTDLGPKMAVGSGFSLSAVKGNVGNTDLAVFWTEQTDLGAFGNLAYLNSPPLAPKYKPTKEELSKEGDKNTGFSVAAVKAQQVAGIHSPFQLKMRISPYVKDAKNREDALKGVEKGLDTIRPAIPADVRAELVPYVMGMFGYVGTVGL